MNIVLFLRPIDYSHVASGCDANSAAAGCTCGDRGTHTRGTMRCFEENLYLLSKEIEGGYCIFCGKMCMDCGSVFLYYCYRTTSGRGGGSNGLGSFDR